MRRTAKANSIEGRINGNGRIFTAALIVFLVFQKQVYAGLASGSVKG